MNRFVTVVISVLLLCGISFSQNLGFNGIAGHVGLLLPQEDGLETGFGFGVVADMGEISDGLGLFPKLYYQLPGTEEPAIGDYSISVLVIGADVHYAVNQDFYAGGGLALYNKMWEAEYTILGQKYTDDDSESDIGISLLGGYNLNLGTMPATIEASYNIVADYNHLEIALNVFFNTK